MAAGDFWRRIKNAYHKSQIKRLEHQKIKVRFKLSELGEALNSIEDDLSGGRGTCMGSGYEDEDGNLTPFLGTGDPLEKAYKRMAKAEARRQKKIQNHEDKIE